jgi:hypothetical protein
MEMNILDTLGKLHYHGQDFSAGAPTCGSRSRYWDDVRARRAPKPAVFDIDLDELIGERGKDCLIIGLAPIPCSRCGSLKTETRVTAPAKSIRN